MSRVDLTVAICTWNRASLLERALSSLAAASRPRELRGVLVIDNGSTDETPQVARGLSGRLPIRLIAQSLPGLSASRNAALNACDTSHILFTDDDVIVDKEWITAFLAAAARHPDATVFGGPIRPIFESPPPQSLIAAFPLLARGFCGVDHGGPERSLEPGSDVYGANMGFRLAGLGVAAFDTRFGPVRERSVTGEETTLVDALRAAGHAVVWVPDMQVEHLVSAQRMSPEYLLRFTRDVARGQVRRHGVPVGRRVLGIPAWLVRRAFERRAAAALMRRGSSEWLTALREYNHLRGLAEEAWRLSRERPGSVNRAEQG